MLDAPQWNTGVSSRTVDVLMRCILEDFSAWGGESVLLSVNVSKVFVYKW